MSVQDLKNVVNAVCDDYRDQLNEDLQRVEQIISLASKIHDNRSARFVPNSFIHDTSKAIEIVHKLNTVEVLRTFLIEAVEDADAEQLLDAGDTLRKVQLEEGLS